MDFLLGIAGNDFTVMVADKMSARSVLLLKSDQEKMLPLGPHSVLALAGSPGDCSAFGEYVQANIALYRMKNGTSLTTNAMANFTRNELAKSIRSRSPYEVNALIGGVEESGNPVLYWLDYLGTMAKVPFAAHGYGSNFVLGLLDRSHKTGMALPEVLDIVRECLAELKMRFVINLADFSVRVVDKDGSRSVSL